MLYSDAAVSEIEKACERTQNRGDEVAMVQILERYTDRMHDFSEFMKRIACSGLPVDSIACTTGLLGFGNNTDSKN